MIHIKDDESVGAYLGGGPLLDSLQNSGFKVGDGIDARVIGPGRRKQSFKGVLVVDNDGRCCVQFRHKVGEPQLATLKELFRGYDGDYVEITVKPWPDPKSSETAQVLQVKNPKRVSF
jgi:hypothetical protein